MAPNEQCHDNAHDSLFYPYEKPDPTRRVGLGAGIISGIEQHRAVRELVQNVADMRYKKRLRVAFEEANKILDAQ